MKFDAVIFDMDGLLLDTERVSSLANREALLEYGHDLPVEQFHALAGGTLLTVAEKLADWTGAKIDAEEFHNKWLLHYNAFLADGPDLRPTVLETLQAVESQALPKAIATTTAKDHARTKLSKAGIEHRFDSIVGFYCVEKRKPNPDPYLKAAANLNVDPRACLAFEDSDTGVKAALAAGMTVVQVPDIAKAEAREAHYRVETLIEGLQAVGLQ
ncbi:MAG: HAD family phosphatase [Pseudomonadota bacterium]